MRVIADIHLHSKYSRACSKQLDLEHNAEWATLKGINLLGTADFTHPQWLKELRSKLEPENQGLFRLKNSSVPVRFMLTTELSCIYSQGGKTRRIHLCVFSPSLETVAKINGALEKRQVNLKADGRPIMGLSAIDLTQLILEIDPTAMVVPAHAWTPWFSVFGSNSGFDSLEECFGPTTKEIFAIETGLSSDPPMNWRLSALDKITLISNSDAHSPANLGREANVFDLEESEITYDEIRRILKEKDSKKFKYTIEFFPHEGKYHYDGHRDCGIVFSPAETKKNRGICPKCKKPLTIGVDHRVDQLADRPIDQKGTNTIPFKSAVPLQEIIAEVYGVGKNSKKVQATFHEIIKKGGDEFTILLDSPPAEIEKIAGSDIATAIANIRAGRVYLQAGYDGVYGVVRAFPPGKKVGLQQEQLL